MLFLCVFACVCVCVCGWFFVFGCNLAEVVFVAPWLAVIVIMAVVLIVVVVAHCGFFDGSASVCECGDDVFIVMVLMACGV